MSPSWGVYSGFELFEHLPNERGREEYLDSEKYEYRPRDFNSQPNLNLLLGQLNSIRERHPALQQLRDVDFHHTSSDQVIAFSKHDGDDTVLVVCSLDPDNTVEAGLELNLGALGIGEDREFQVRDELTGQEFWWRYDAYVRLYPGQPAHILHVTGQ